MYKEEDRKKSPNNDSEKPAIKAALTVIKDNETIR